jgi:hypothetical protein
VQDGEWILMFPDNGALIENQLRMGVGENKPVSDVLKIVTPQYLSIQNTDLIPTMLNTTIVYFTNLDDINGLVQQMTEVECQHFKVSIIDGIGPLWTSIALKKNSSWFEEINAIVTHRLTRSFGAINAVIVILLVFIHSRTLYC